ncbi:3-hydroxyacyl-ACP dehydratase FabZ family protein [Nannocystaceae bacterium ST9]
MLSLDIDAAGIERLIPHRPPLRLVDRIDGFAPGRSPRLRAWLEIDGREPVFAGHFPGAPIWPGAYLIEGVAQCAGLLLALQSIHASTGEAGLRSSSEPGRPIATGLLARAALDFRAPVRPPASLRYEVQLLGSFGDLIKIDGHVTVEGKTVAEGSVVVVPGPLEPAP